jgi:NADP-dependent 3-hydroxy acid dehydrogenase YdfG
MGNPKTFVLITGITHGLGRAMADEFVRLGHTVLGCGRSKEEIAHLRSRFGPPHDFEIVDVAADQAVEPWASVVSHK